jgi:hypothetical protein
MIQLNFNSDKFKAAAIRGAGTLAVRMTKVYRSYIVVNKTTGAEYHVNFAVLNGAKLAGCDCKGASAGYVCKHIAVAAHVHAGIAAQRRDS